jgi:glycosyltransferase involved in cell wall biosynthesis
MSGSATKTVLHLSTTSGPGGAEMVLSRLAASLDQARFRSVVCLFWPGWLKEQCERLGIATYVLQMEGMLDYRWLCKAWQLVRQENVALIHAHEFGGNTYGALLAQLAGVPLIATVHGKNYYWEKLRRRLAYRLVSRIGMMVAVSNDLKRFIVNTVGMPAHRIKVVHNGIDTMSPVGPEEVRRHRAELGLVEGEKVVGVVGSLYPAKGHRYLLAAVQQVLKTSPHVIVLIIGRGELESPLKEEVKRLGLSQQVRFLGFRNDIPALLALMDVFVLPSLSEGLSIALLEAMSAGKPVLATDVGGNPELVVDGETGFLVPPREAEALAARLLLLLNDKDQARRLGEKGRKRVLQHFTLRAMVSRYQRIYEDCLQMQIKFAYLTQKTDC